MMAGAHNVLPSMHIKCSQQSLGTLLERGLVHPPPPMTNSH